MNKLILGLLLLFSTSRAVDTLSIPTDFNTVNSGTRANLSGNFTSIGTWAGKIRDTVAQVTGRVSGYSGTLLISSLSNLRLKLDADNSETARFVVESGTGDSLFRVSEDTTAKFFGPLTTASTLNATGKVTGSDTVAALLGFRAGNTAASNVNLYRLSADMWKTDDSLTVAGSGRFNGSLGIGISPAAPLDVIGSNSTTSRAAMFRTGLTTGGAAADYVDVLFRHVNSIGGYIDGASIRSTVVNPANGTRTSKLGLYGSNNEVQTLGLEISATGAATFPGTVTADSLISSKFYEENTFTGTLGGCASGGTGTIYYTRVGKSVTLLIPSIICTSNSTSGVISGVPASINPSRAVSLTGGYSILDNGTSTAETPAFISEYIAVVTTSNTIQLYKNGSTAFTASGTKGFRSISVPGTPALATVSYTLQ